MTESRIQELTHTYMIYWLSANVQRQFNGESCLFKNHCWNNYIFTCKKKKKINPHFAPLEKLTQVIHKPKL